MNEPTRDDLIYDWNEIDLPPRPTHMATFDDESLRDGLQSPSVRNPTIDQKIEILVDVKSHAHGPLPSPEVGRPC